MMPRYHPETMKLKKTLWPLWPLWQKLISWQPNQAQPARQQKCRLT